MKWKNKGHEFDELGTAFQKNRELYLWGTNSITADFAVLAKGLALNVRVVDEIWRWRYYSWMGLDVVPPSQVLHDPEGKTVLIPLNGAELENVYAKLTAAGFERDVSCFQIDEFREKWLGIYAVYANDKVYFPHISFLCTTRCNLNCAACLNFTPYLEHKRDEPIDKLKEQVDLFFSCVDYIGFFQICGGEPMMYPYLKELVAYIDTNYRSQMFQLQVVTNGTRELSDELCRTFREHHAMVICDDYRETLPEIGAAYSNCVTRMERCGVWHVALKVPYWFDLMIEETDNSWMSEEELVAYKTSCGHIFQEYYQGRLYSCNYASYAAKAGLTVCGSEEYLDFRDLTGDRKKELVEFRYGYSEKGYMEFCKRCAAWNNDHHCLPAAQKRGRGHTEEGSGKAAGG